jgi:hypothetical protein
MSNIDYTKFNFEDFSKDNLFRSWVLYKDEQAERFWHDWLTVNPDFSQKIQLARAFLLALEEKDTDLDLVSLERITDEVAIHPKKLIPIWKSPFWRMAVAICLVFGSGIWYFNPYKTQDTRKIYETAPIFSNVNNEFIEKRNVHRVNLRITFKDGSTVVLYPNSILRYPREFEKSRREVYLTGKAFFKVVKNPQKPFWVYTDHISTQVLGTRFLVNAARNKDIFVEVHSGKVSVYTRKDQERTQLNLPNESIGVILTPNQKVAYSAKEERLLKSIVAQPIALVNLPPQDFILDERPVSEAFSLLEKMYGITVIYDGQVMQDCFLTANLSDESLFKKLDLICKITHSTYEKTDAQIVIHSEGCLK